MKRKIFALFLIAALLLCACQETPETQAVISKNDDAFDANAAVSASETHAPDATQAAQYTDSFTSTDGSVEFYLTIDETVTDADMPVVEAEPHILTSEDTKNIAQALFGEMDFYEAGHVLYPEYSKSQIQERLARWAPYANDTAAIEELYGKVSNTPEIIQNYITQYTEKLETASDEDPRVLTQWEFRDRDYRWSTAEEIAERGLEGSVYEIPLEISANGIYYTFESSIRDEETSKLSWLSVYPGCGPSPDGLDKRIFVHSLCCTEKPTQEQIDNAEEIALELLNNMGLGEWAISESSVIELIGEGEYAIEVKAAPVLEGIAVAWKEKGDSVSGDAYAFSYYETSADIKLSADGILLQFDLISPIDEVQTVNDNVAVMSMDELLERAKEQLSLSDAYAYSGSWAMEAGENVRCVITIDHLEYSLNRMAKKDSFDTFYYVPSITLSGSVEYTNESTGELYWEEEATFLCLNAVDGSVIEQ